MTTAALDLDTTANAPPAAGWLRREYELCDVDEQAQLLGTLDQRYEQLSGGTYSGRLLEINCEGIDIFRGRIGQSVQQQGVGRAGHWTFAAAVKLPAPSYWNGELIASDTMICFEPNQEFDLRTPKYTECVGFSIAVDVLRDHLASWQSDDLEMPLAGRSIVTRDGERIDPTRQVLLEIIDTAHTVPSVFEHAPARKMMVNSVLNRLADAIDTDVTGHATPTLARQSQVARAARDYIYAHAAEPFSIAEMCRHVGVSRRTLQYAFESVFGLNPLSYVRAVRLNAVRRELKRAANATVQDSAAQWGFWHLPRFARAYADMFGELPSVTLRQARVQLRPT